MILVEIAGFLGADAEERFTASGKKVVSLRVATRVRQGGAEETVWWRVTIWGDRYDKMVPYLKKGASVLIVGEMAKPETYTTKDGATAISLSLNAEIVKFSPFGKPESRDTVSSGGAEMMPLHSQASYGSVDTSESMAGHTHDDLPF